MRKSLSGALVVAALIAGCGSSAKTTARKRPHLFTTVSPRPPGPWTGFGGKLADWEAGHPKTNSTGSGCSPNGCFGPIVEANGKLLRQFSGLSTTGPPDHRVKGFDLAMPQVTSLALARTTVQLLLPPDTQTTAFQVIHGKNGSCALWSVRSRTVGRWFAAEKIGDPQGAIGVILDSPQANGETVFDKSHTSHARVGIAASREVASC